MQDAWWKKSVVYQIYPKSFLDTTGDGIGDLRGIIHKLDYLRELGVDILWLTPIYESPQRDNGYDISDYYRVNPQYGTMAELETLFDEAHRRDMKVVMDIVVNHTSTDHMWFQEARKSKDSPYRDFYIWRDEPNNWLSKFGGSAWAYDEAANQYYLHLFDVTQADLNWENPKLRDEIYQMMNFWVEKGVDGFRLDVINLISKNQQFPDDTLETSTEDGRRYYTDGPRIHEYLKEMNQRVFANKPGFVTVGEMSSTSLEHCVKYTNPNERELNMTFSFHHLKVDYPNGEKWVAAPFDFVQLKEILSQWQVGMQQGGGWNALFWCNHDQPRVVSRFGNDAHYREASAKMLATALHLLKGTPYIYQGEEIGMTNPGFDRIEDYRDVESINAYGRLTSSGTSESDTMAALKQKSRDNSRTPMQWDASNNAGFTTGTPWIRVAPNYRDVNVDDALANPDSIFYHYQKLIRLRKTHDVIVYGDYRVILPDDPQLFVYLRTYKNDTILVINNFYAVDAKFVLPSEISIAGATSEILVSNYKDTPNTWHDLDLRPYESVAFYIRGPHENKSSGDL
ncbi:alpha,alpha-phosphotrehalase [Alicyclobacillus fastidiosus]|uniref:Alpha,alpha-phosphotrehalase n=1 Tax=Alicyclobacillus fastidiosus TaxID=392011 RepID=A0ABY6ZGR0_9BACL|nr:alpha,alpha-phosphotrehalase [Alicyclobacillus fastidiosus]WAH42094.1 alpha,alpha-phosphotrehalase [Alicyclobacillus fastidiosus]GMA63861.1 alpha,alpha-phosphotrehalase [Alicyclobacillus fastidiosus]